MMNKFSDLNEKKIIKSKIIKTIKESLSNVEKKRINEIKSILKLHKKISSSELSLLMGLSRTRCNEYFKIMEKMRIVEPFFSRKKKYYILKK